MTISRRGFLKLVAAAGAVAIVPVQAVEAIAPMLPPPARPAEAAARRLWQIREQAWVESIGDTMKLDLILVAGSCRIELGMHVDPSTSVDLFDFDGIELDVRMVDGKMRVFIDEKPAEGVYRFIVGVEYPMFRFESSDGVVHTISRGADTEPLKQLTAYKHLRGEKP